jgi:hypothetical protein
MFLQRGILTAHFKDVRKNFDSGTLLVNKFKRFIARSKLITRKLKNLPRTPRMTKRG